MKDSLITWYWVVSGCFRNFGIEIAFVKDFSKYWYWVLLRAIQSIGIGIGYWYWGKKVVLLMSALVHSITSLSKPTCADMRLKLPNKRAGAIKYQTSVQS